MFSECDELLPEAERKRRARVTVRDSARLMKGLES